MRGQYQDTLRDRKGALLRATGWSPNTIVDSAWPLLAGLLRNDPALGGILFWAVGAGDPAWDGTHTAASAATVQLQNETDRQAIAPGDVRYVEEDGSPAPGPTTRLEVRATFSWPDARTVREFGLFGGDATTAAGSGSLINYVIHPRIDLAPGAKLSRRLRLTLRPDLEAGVPALPAHWIGGTTLTAISGIGANQAAAFAASGITTLGELAAIDPIAPGIGLPLPRRVELHARARLVLRTAGRLSPVAGLLGHTAWAVVTTPTATLAADAGAPEAQVTRLQEQVGDLAAALNTKFLQGVTIGNLAQPL